MYTLQEKKLTLCIIENMDETPGKNQYRKIPS